QANPNIWMEDPFTEEDINLIEEIPEVEQVVATSSEATNVSYREETVDGYVTGINQSYLDVHGLKIQEGRNLQRTDFLSGSRAAIISESFEEDLLEYGDEILGKVIYVSNQPVEVIG